jgi:hypothetical protein
MSSKPFFDLEAYVPSANSNMLGITDPEIDVASVGTIRNFNAKMISWHEVAQRIIGNHPDKTQAYLTERQGIGWWRK